MSPLVQSMCTAFGITSGLIVGGVFVIWMITREGRR